MQVPSILSVLALLAPLAHGAYTFTANSDAACENAALGFMGELTNDVPRCFPIAKVGSWDAVEEGNAVCVRFFERSQGAGRLARGYPGQLRFQLFSGNDCQGDDILFGRNGTQEGCSVGADKYEGFNVAAKSLGVVLASESGDGC